MAAQGWSNGGGGAGGGGGDGDGGRYWGRPGRERFDSFSSWGSGGAGSDSARGHPPPKLAFKSMKSMDDETLRQHVQPFEKKKQSSFGSLDSLQEDGVLPVAAAGGGGHGAHGGRRARDDSFHRNSSGASNSTVTSAGSNVVPRKPRRRRANTTNTFFLSSTMQKPVVKDTMVCVVAVVHGHMVAAAQAAPGGRTFDPRYAVFDDTTQGGSGERAHARVTPAHVRVQGGGHHRGGGARGRALHVNAAALRRLVPDKAAVLKFISQVFEKGQLENDCLIMTLVYLERLLKVGASHRRGGLALLRSNWRPILLICMIMASKVWDDLSMWNADFSLVCPSFTLQRINELEVALLDTLKYARRDSAEHFSRLKVQCCTAMAWIFIPVYCFAVP